MPKHKSVKSMMKSKNLSSEDISNYAVMNTSDNDIDKTRNLINLINKCVDLEVSKVQHRCSELIKQYSTGDSFSKQNY